MDGQKQKVGENGVALQAGGDINIGLRYADIKEIFYDLFQQNFPMLAKIARDEAKKNVDDCFAKLEQRLILEKENIDANKFSQSNTQFLLNDAIQICARKGSKIDMDSLLDVFTLTLCRNTSPMLELVSEQVLNIFPRLTRDYINVLTVIHIVAKVRMESAVGIENAYRKLIDSIGLNAQITEDVGLYLDSLGLVSKTSGVFRPYEYFSKTYSLGLSSVNEIKEKIKADFPAVYQVYEYFLNQKIDQLIPTPSGMLVALLNMKKLGLGDIDYNIWIH